MKTVTKSLEFLFTLITILSLCTFVAGVICLVVIDDKQDPFYQLVFEVTGYSLIAFFIFLTGALAARQWVHWIEFEEWINRENVKVADLKEQVRKEENNG